MRLKFYVQPTRLADHPPRPHPIHTLIRVKSTARQVRDAIVVARRVLGAERELALPADVPHAYADKYALVEAQLGSAAVGVLSALGELGLSPAALRTLVGWSAGGAEVTLRFSGAVTSEFVREERKEVTDPVSVTTVKRAGGLLSSETTTRVTRTVTEFVWALAAEWRVEAVRGTGRGEGDVLLLASRANGRAEQRTSSKDARLPPRQATTAEAPLTWLLRALDASAPGLPARVVVDRSADSCKTPRRNATAEAALACFGSLDAVLSAVTGFVSGPLANAARLAFPDAPPQLDVARADDLVVPAVLFDTGAPARGQQAAGAAAATDAPPASTLALLPPPDSAAPAVLDLSALNDVVAEARTALRVRVGDAALAAGGRGTSRLLGGEEAAALVGAAYALRLTAHARDGLDYVEGMLRDQLVVRGNGGADQLSLRLSLLL